MCPSQTRIVAIPLIASIAYRKYAQPQILAFLHSPSFIISSHFGN
jgi:hypothetical protein